jgi:hypothetical protein
LSASPRTRSHVSPRARCCAQHRHTEAILEYEAVIALNRNWAHEYSHLGWCKFMTGAIEGRFGSRPWENVRDPRQRRIVFSIAFFGQPSPALLVSDFYAQIECRGFRTASVTGGKTLSEYMLSELPQIADMQQSFLSLRQDPNHPI